MSRKRQITRCALAAIALATAGVVLPHSAQAQQQAGVVVDAEGVLHKQVHRDPTGALTRQRIDAARATLDPDIQQRSPLRKVSLTRLESALAEQLAGQRRPTDEMLHLAGLTRLEYVFFYPETGDVVIAGPAEGWARDLSGRARGMFTGRPVLKLEDLTVALRAYPPGQMRGPVIGCSIDPTQEGLTRLQKFLVQFGPRATPRDTQFIVESLKEAMGLQTVTILGIPATTHFAQVMVEADYRMKLIGIGLERPAVRMDSYVDRVRPTQVAANALQRWYFMPDYECVRMSDDGLAMKLEGNGVKLVGEDEVVTAGGQRRSAATANAASKAFTNQFTQKYEQIADASPVYAQLRNLIDMAIAAAHIQKQDYYAQAGWQMPILGDETKFSVEKYNAPKQVETVVTSIWKGNRLMTPLGGGVTIEADQALLTRNLLPDEDGAVKNAQQQTKLELEPGQWWWD